MKKRRGRMFGTLMSAVLLTAELAGVSGLAFGANPVTVQADESEFTMKMWTTGIDSGDLICFGKVDPAIYDQGTANYRVLDADYANDDTENAIFVLSTGLWGTGEDGGITFNNAVNNVWQESQAQTWCEAFYGASLSAIEQDALVNVAKTDDEGTWFDRGPYSSSELSGDPDVDLVFFLSTEEVYDYISDEMGPDLMADYGDNVGMWWLRTPIDTGDFPDNGVMIVDNEGEVRGDFVYVEGENCTHAARPAFNINAENVVFSSASFVEKSDFASSTLKPVEWVDGNVAEWNLTLLDDSLWVDYDVASSYEENERKIMLSDFERSGNGDRVSVLIAYGENGENETDIRYYGKLDETDASFIIPNGVDLAGWGSDYNIYIVEEKLDDDHASDYASEMVEVLAPGEVYDVTVTAGTGGTATADCYGAVEGEIVTLTATPGAGYSFKKWEVVDGDVDIDDVNSTSATFEMPAGPVSVKAIFEKLAEDETSVTVTAGKGGKAEADKLSAKIGDEVKLVADADKDYEFDKWIVVSGDIEIADEKEAVTTFVVNSVDEPIEIEAVFKKADGGKEPSGHNHHQCEKGHLYTYTICQAPTTEVDGYATWRCSRCGIIDPLHADELDEEGFIVIPAFPVFNSTLNDNIKGAKDNATVSISTKRWTGVSRTVLASLAERKDVTLEISFVYMNVEYVITLKGDDPRLAELLNMEVKDNCLGLKLIYDYVNAPAIQ